MPPLRTTVPHDVLEKFMADALNRVGVPENDAKICANVLISSDLRGIESHGIGRLKPIYLDRIEAGQINPITKIELVKETPTTAVINAHNGMGQVAAYQAMELAIGKAKKFGMGMTAVRNSNHYGIAGYYAQMACNAGMLGVTGTNARPSIAPTFGVENMLGTNPLVFGFPTDEEFPFILDAATSVSQRGKIEVYDRLGKELPKGWVIGSNGEPRTDTKQILVDLVKGSAALTPLGGIGEETGGHKGYGYATVVEILCAALQQGAFLRSLGGLDAAGNKQPYRLGHFFMAIDITAFTELSLFKKSAGEILRQLRASRKAPGHERIYTANEKEYEAEIKHRRSGIPVEASLVATIKDLSMKYSLPKYGFPWE